MEATTVRRIAGVKTLVYDLVLVGYVIIGLAVYVPWVLLSLAPDNQLFLQISDFIYWFFSHFCHQLWFRSYFFDDIKQPVCARCVSIYAATALGLIYFRLKGFGGLKEFRLNYLLLFLLFLPTALDGTTQWFGLRESTNELRLLAGFPFGLGYAYIIAWGLPLAYALIELIIVGLKMGEVEPIVERIKKMVWPF